ncbi:hypothetical protein XENTR_v10019191 [Xenopus tropicalis]|nr:hypothetical protein XENTR_v10019191 [Xenopus tropicalis]
MFGDLFEEDEDFSILPSSPNTNGKKSHPRDSKTPEPQGDTRLSGLRNQGGTCYLNSLLRTLFLHQNSEKPFLLWVLKNLDHWRRKTRQSLRCELFPCSYSVSSLNFCCWISRPCQPQISQRAFGWNSSEETSQHDVQELNRILFSAHWRAHLAMTSSSDCTMAPLLTASSARSVATSVKGRLLLLTSALQDVWRPI